jgi:hypothetical protein
MNLVQKSVEKGGKLAPLIIPPATTSGMGLMNPSVFVDDDGEILVNLRHTNYTLYHSENDQMFPSRWGPLSYLHPEIDHALRTKNYLCRLNDDLEITDYTLVDTAKLDTEPRWTFSGQEDARLVKWDGHYYLVGVRRDTEYLVGLNKEKKSDGQGRMEYSRIKLNKENWTAVETHRQRIPTPGEDFLNPRESESYCEKNWVPILERPHQFIKWTSPVEVVMAVPGKVTKTKQVSVRQGIRPPKDQRGSSQLVRWGSMFLSITHEVDLPKNYLGQKDGTYRHRLCVWDEQLNLVGLSNEFSFLDAKVEFCAGAAVHNGDLLISFGFQDNAAFVLRTPGLVVEDLIVEALNYDNQ